MELFKKYWPVIMIIFAIATWSVRVEFAQADGEKKDKSQDSEIRELKVIAKDLHKISQQNAEILSDLSGQLKVILTVLLPKAKDSVIERWNRMPTKKTIDSFGNPVIGCEWLIVSSDYLVGTSYKWFAPDSVLKKIAWDERAK